MAQRRFPLPALFSAIRFLIDSGSEVSAVTDSLLVANMPERGFHKLNTLGGTVQLPAFEVDLTFLDHTGPATLHVDRVLIGAVPGRPWRGHPYHGIIGRDVLDRLDVFEYRGLSNGCALEL